MPLARRALLLRLASFASLPLVACSDPALDPSAGGAPEPPTATTSAPPPPEAPAGGMPAAPPPGEDNPTEMPWSRAQGETVTLSGTVSYPGSRTGRVRIDFLGATEANVGLQQMVLLPQPGAWTVEAPVDAGKVHVVAFLQEGQAGPPLPDQPAGRLAEALDIADRDLGGLDLVLRDEPDLGDLTPRSPGEGGPPPGAPPPTDASPPTTGAPPPAEGAATPAGAPPPAEGAATP
ncbi:hypothetical protein L6R53_18420 [Myxococcota bacterium]|nr:hypothetical protein [Myxococcota bacterium]